MKHPWTYAIVPVSLILLCQWLKLLRNHSYDIKKQPSQSSHLQIEIVIFIILMWLPERSSKELTFRHWHGQLFLVCSLHVTVSDYNYFVKVISLQDHTGVEFTTAEKGVRYAHWLHHRATGIVVQNWLTQLK